MLTPLPVEQRAQGELFVYSKLRRFIFISAEFFVNYSIGINMKNKSIFWTNDELDFLEKNYSNTDYSKEYFEKRFNRSWEAIKARANRFSGNKRKYTIDDDYFNIIDSWDKCYILGWLWSDGNNYPKKSTINLTLQESDKEILEYIKYKLKYNGPIFYNPSSIIKPSPNFKTKGYIRKPQYKLSFCSKIISKKLNDYGMIPKKSLTLEFPKCIPEEFINAFLLGYFEGDGCIGIYSNGISPSFSIRSTKEFCEQYQEYLLKYCGINKTKIMKDTTYKIQYYGKEKLIKIRNFLYENAEMHLSRKFSKFNLLC